MMYKLNDDNYIVFKYNSVEMSAVDRFGRRTNFIFPRKHQDALLREAEFFGFDIKKIIEILKFGVL
jgi:hypothetical protein